MMTLWKLTSIKNRFDPSSRQLDFISISFLFSLALLFFWRVPFQGRVLLPLDVLYTYEPWRSEVPGALGVQLWNPWLSDGVRQFYPVLTFVQSSWRQGQIPFWDPHSATGMLILAAGLHQALYPLTVVLLMLMPVAYALSWSILLHTFLAGLFCFLWLREMGVGRFGALFGAIAFMFSGSLVLIMSSLGRFPTIIWLPLLLWSFERALKRQNWRWTVVGGLILGLQILAGHVQMMFYSTTALGLYTAYRAFWDWFDNRNFRQAIRPLLYLGVILLVGLGLSAIQMLPMAELLPQGIRSEVDFETDFSWRLLLRVLLPDILGTDMDRNLAAGFSHEVYVYLGLLALLFMIASLFSAYRRLAWGLISAGVLIWLVIFKVPPLYQLFELFYPSFKTLGFHRAQILIAFFWAIAAGLGADWILTKPRPTIKWLLIAGGVLAMMMGGFLLWLAFVSKYQARFMWSIPALEEMKPPPTYILGSLIFALVILSACLILFWFWRQQRINQAVFVSAALMILVVDLFLANIDYNSAFDPAMLYPQTPSLKFLQNLSAQETQPYRILSVDRLFWGDIATVFGLDDVQGYDSFLMKRYNQYIDLTGARKKTNFRIAAFNAHTSKLLDALNVKYFYMPRYTLTEGEWVSLLSEVNDPAVQSERISGEQVGEWIIEGWPQKVLLATPYANISYQGFLQYPAQLETAIAIDPEVWNQPGVDVLFEVYIKSAASFTDTLLFSKHLTQTQPDDMRWTPVVVDLSDFTGQEVTLSLVTSSPNPETSWSVGWADPVLMDSSKVALIYYGPNSIYLNKNYLPRAWVVHQVTRMAEKDVNAVEAVLTRKDFNPAEEAVIEGDLPEPLSPEVKTEPVEFIAYTPASVKLKTELATSGLLIMSDAYYPGWKVYVDGVETSLYATNLMMRGVFVPAGLHQIEFIYDPISFRIGLYISAATIILVCSWLIVDWRLLPKIQRKVAGTL